MDPRRRAELLADDNDTAAAWEERRDAERMDRPAENFIVVDLVITNRLKILIFVCNAAGRGNNHVNRSCWTHAQRRCRSVFCPPIFYLRFAAGGGGLQA